MFLNFNVDPVRTKCCLWPFSTLGNETRMDRKTVLTLCKERLHVPSQSPD